MKSINIKVLLAVLSVINFFSCRQYNPTVQELAEFGSDIINCNVETVRKKIKSNSQLKYWSWTEYNSNTIPFSWMAAYTNNLDIIKLVVDKKNVNSYTCIEHHSVVNAVFREDYNIEVIKYIFSLEPNLTFCNVENTNFLHNFSHECPCKEIWKIFADKITPEMINKRNKANYTPIMLLFAHHYIVDSFSNEDCSYLLEEYIKKGADVNDLLDYEYFTIVLDFLIKYHVNDYITLILDNMTKKLPDDKWGANYLHQAFACADYEIVPKILPLINNINSTNKTGQTALHFAAGYAVSIELLKLLLNSGADKSIKDEDGLTPLEFYKKFNDKNEIDRNILELLG